MVLGNETKHQLRVIIYSFLIGKAQNARNVLFSAGVASFEMGNPRFQRMEFFLTALANKNLGLRARHLFGPSTGRNRVPHQVFIQVCLGGEELFAVVALDVLKPLVHSGRVPL